MSEIIQILIGIISGTTVSGVALFRWGWQFQKITAQTEARIDLLGKELKDLNEQTLHRLILLEKDLKHSDEVSGLLVKNDIEGIKAKVAINHSRISDLERYLTKINGFKARHIDKDTQT